MALIKLCIKDLRNIQSAEIYPSLSTNIIVGANASGKSSLLEAIHLLLVGKSFRTTRPEQIIRNNQESFLITSLLGSHDSPIKNSLGVRRDKKQTIIKFSGQRIKTAADLAKLQPVVVITPETQNLVLGGSAKRRTLIDWLLFHVEQSYFSIWSGYHNILKQRNRLLKKNIPGEELYAWEAQLITSGEALDKKRQSIILKLLNKLQAIISDYMDLPIRINYQRGWDEGTLQNCIDRSRNRDRALGYTTKGPHRADLNIQINNQNASQVLSRGQTKFLSILIETARSALLQEITGKKIIVLVDDMAAELDLEKRIRFTQVLFSLKTQLFVTTTERAMLPEILLKDSKVFHVEQGSLQEVLY